MAILYSLVPFILVYYVTGMRMPRKLLRSTIFLSIVSILLIFPFMESVRIYLAAVLSGNELGLFDVMGDGYSIPSIILGFASRVGASFDVLSFVVAAKPEFFEYSNLSAEFIDVLNRFLPGDLFSVDAPIWARILYSLGHSANLAAVIALGTGENITMPAHLYIYFNLFGVFLVAFCLMILISATYNLSSSVFIRVSIIYLVIFDISNGSGLVSMIFAIPLIFIYMTVIHFSYKVGRTFLRLKMGKHNLRSRAIV